MFYAAGQSYGPFGNISRENSSDKVIWFVDPKQTVPVSPSIFLKAAMLSQYHLFERLDTCLVRQRECKFRAIHECHLCKVSFLRKSKQIATKAKRLHSLLFFGVHSCNVGAHIFLSLRFVQKAKICAPIATCSS